MGEDLFTHARKLARTTDRATSHAAARRIVPFLTDLQAKILEAIRSYGAHGCTDDQLCGRFQDMRESTVRTRRSELVGRRKVVDSGRRAKTASNRDTIIWIAAEFANAAGV